MRNRRKNVPVTCVNYAEGKTNTLSHLLWEILVDKAKERKIVMSRFLIKLNRLSQQKLSCLGLSVTGREALR